MKKNVVLSILLFFGTGILTAAAAYFYAMTYMAIIPVVLAAMVGVGTVLFLHADARVHDSLPYGAAKRFDRFCLLYFIGLIAALIFPVLPVAGWPFLVIFVVMGLCSAPLIGIVSGATLLLISVLLCGSPAVTVFFSYFLAGVVAVVLFSYVDEAFRVGLPLLISISINLVLIAANIMMSGQPGFGIETIIIVLSNLLVCVLLLLVFLRYLSSLVIHKDRNRYMEINDPECPILVELKQKSLTQYYQAVHTAYLSDKIAKKLGLCDMAARTCGYYHKIGVLRGENSWEAIHDICLEYKFPAPAIALLKEYTDNESSLVSKEAVVVLFADTLVASILYIFSKNPRANPDYAQIIDAIYEKKASSGILDKSLLTMGEMKEMLAMLKEEHLYYDFLR